MVSTVTFLLPSAITARCQQLTSHRLISASVGTVVYYGFQDPQYHYLRNGFLTLCFCTGLAGNVFPFMKWFDTYKYRGWRILFFLALAFSSIAPLAHFAFLYSFRDMLHDICTLRLA